MKNSKDFQRIVLAKINDDVYVIFYTFLGPYCCLNGANNPDCCDNNGSGEFE
jgi:hypothetical protein